MTKHVIILILPLFLLSCSIPPSDTSRVPFLKSIESFLESEENPASIPDFFNSLRKLENTPDLITEFSAEDIIVLIGQKTIPNEKTLLYTLGGNRLLVHKTIFVTTSRNGKYFFSPDGSNWYEMANYMKKGIQNINYIYPVESDYDMVNNILYLNFEWAAEKSDYAKVVSMKKKETILLDENMIFLSNKNSDNTINIKNYYLKIPAGTEIQFHIKFSGNLLNSTFDDNKNQLQILRDFYIYTTDDSDYKLGISTDGITWNYNILSFRYNVTSHFETDSNKKIQYWRDMNIYYKFND